MYDRIRALREDSDLTQKELAALLQLHQTTYSSYELGKLDIPTAALVRLAAFYHTSVDYILGLTNERKPYPRA